MTTTAHEDQFTVGTQTIETVRQPYSTVAILRRNIADMEVALKQQTERAEAAEAELAKLREQKPVLYYVEQVLNGEVVTSMGQHETCRTLAAAEERARIIRLKYSIDSVTVIPLYALPLPVPHKGATHCDDCGLTWLDDGLNPLRCPYCKDPVPAPAVPQNELVAAITVYLKADDEMHQATRRTGFGGMGKPVASEAEQRHLAAIRHAARGHLEALLQSAEVTNAAADRLMEGGE